VLFVEEAEITMRAKISYSWGAGGRYILGKAA